MKSAHTFILAIFSILVAWLISTGTDLFAQEIYRWVDENGVVNFSENAPPGETAEVRKIVLEKSNPADHDPEEDVFNIEATSERMQAYREDMAKRREARLESQRNASQQQVVQYREPRRYGSPLYWYPPYRPQPPIEPQPPVAEPYPTVPYRPPGSQ